MLGGLPMISEVARSSANVGYGAVTRWANFFHGLFLLLAVLVAVPFIEMIPNVALAAMLVFVGFRLAHPREFKHTFHIGKEQLLVFIVTIFITIYEDLLMGVASGIVLEFIINLINGASFKTLFKTYIDISNSGDDYIMKINSDVTFSNILGFKKKFLSIPEGKHVTIDVSKAPIFDHTSIVTMNGLVEDYKDSGGKVNVIGFENHKQLSHAPTSTRILKLS